MIICFSSTFAQQLNADSLKTLLIESKDTTRVRILNQLADVFKSKAPVQSIEYGQEAYELAKKNDHPKGMVLAFYRIGMAQGFNNDYGKAIEYLTQSGKLAEEIGDKKTAANCYMNIGGAYSVSNNYEQQLNFYLKSLGFYQALDDKKGIGLILMGIGNAYTYTTQYDLAMENYTEAIRYFKELNDRNQMAKVYVNIGGLYNSKKEFGKALQFFTKAFDLFKELDNNRGMAASLSGKGDVYFQQGNYALAETNLKEGLQINRKSNHQYSVAENLILLGKVVLAENKFDDATGHFNEAITISQELNSKSNLSAIYLQLANLHQMKSDYKSAFTFYKLYKSYNDSILNIEKTKQLQSLQLKFESEKKEKEIQILKSEKTLSNIYIKVAILAFLVTLVIGVLSFIWYRTISRTKRQLEIERMRNHIAQDLHDDIGSTLSSINMISRMNSQDLLSGSASTSFAQIEDHSGKMLSQMVDIIWSINPGNDTLNEVLLHMKEFAADILEPKNIDYYFHESGNVKNQKIDATIRKNLYLIFKEALNNAMKYSQCTTIQITLTLTASLLTLDIVDNGTGFSMNEVKLGNGLNNMEARAKLMKGLLKIESTQGKGTRLSIVVQIA